MLSFSSATLRPQIRLMFSHLNRPIKDCFIWQMATSVFFTFIRLDFYLHPFECQKCTSQCQGSLKTQNPGKRPGT
jgi:hypothetical protein